MHWLEEDKSTLTALYLPALFAKRLELTLNSHSELESTGLLYRFGYTRNRNPHRAQPPSGVSVNLSAGPPRIGHLSFRPLQESLEPIRVKRIRIVAIFEETHTESAGYTERLSCPVLGVNVGKLPIWCFFAVRGLSCRTWSKTHSHATAPHCVHGLLNRRHTDVIS